MNSTKNEQINQFIIEMTLISPIEKIIDKLNNGEFRDCDIKWLDSKLESFVEFAGKTLGVNCVMPQSENIKPAYANNSYGFNYYKKYFNQLLDYFKTL